MFTGVTQPILQHFQYGRAGGMGGGWCSTQEHANNCKFLPHAHDFSHCFADQEVTCPDIMADTLMSLHDATFSTRPLDVVFLLDEGALTSEQHYWAKQLIMILSEILVLSPKYSSVRFHYEVAVTRLMCLLRNPLSHSGSCQALNDWYATTLPQRANSQCVTFSPLWWGCWVNYFFAPVAAYNGVPWVGYDQCSTW